MSEFHDILSNIVYSREKSPTIINPDSNFVVVTYWWGNTNQNNNLARPCISFYEEYTNRLINSVVTLFNVLSSSKIITSKKDYGYFINELKVNFGKITVLFA